MSLPVTSIYIALATLGLIALGSRIALMRRKHRISLGYGDNKTLGRAIRVHGNYIENLPMALLVMAGLELAGAPAFELHGIGAALLLSRLLHWRGLHGRSGATLGRFWGMTLLWLAMGLAALDLLRRLL